MTRQGSAGHPTVIAIALPVALALVLGAIGCSGSGTTPSATTAGSATTASESTAGTTAGSNSPTTGGTSTKRLVEGAKTDAQYQADISKLQDALKSKPNDLTTLQDLAVAQYNLRQLPETAATYQKMLTIKDDPATRNNYANVLRDEGKTAEAIAEYRKAIAGDKALTTAYVNLAVIYANQSNLAAAKKIVEQGIAATSGDDQARLKTYLEQLKTQG